ncbi:hypothetical protein SNEBB_007280 [Seison nebaliae]|nr:hypothetical protein SNEBB_007280 [Seison nebaliae]
MVLLGNVVVPLILFLSLNSLPFLVAVQSNFNENLAGPCTIVEEYFSNLTSSEFQLKYVVNELPVVIRHDDERRDIMELYQNHFNFHHIVSNFSDMPIIVSLSNTYSYKKRTLTLNDYFKDIFPNINPKQLAWYWFGDLPPKVDRNVEQKWKQFLQLYDGPEKYLVSVKKFQKLQPIFAFGIGAKGTGVPFHWHGPGFAETVHGRKRWFLYAPNYTPIFDGDISSYVWWEKRYGKSQYGLLECTLNEGDLIYFPNGWWHSTLNVDNNIFFSSFLG